MCPTTKVSKYMKHKLTELQGNIVTPTTTPGMVKGFNKPLSVTDRTSIQKISMGVQSLTHQQTTFIEYTSLHTGEYSFFFSNAYGTLTKIKPMGENERSQ